MASTRKIGIVLSSIRPQRIAPKLLSILLPIITPTLPPNTVVETIDLEEWALPFNNDSVVPKSVPQYAQYGRPWIRSWSAEISRYSAFIFLVPEYNGGYPAALKNAIDSLYWEWVGKPAMIISYAVRGGHATATSLKVVLERMEMEVVENPVELSLGHAGAVSAAVEGVIADEVLEEWKRDRKLVDGWKGLIELLNKKKQNEAAA